jgi:hypothetical protein
MKLLDRTFTSAVAGLSLHASLCAGLAATLPSEWKFDQPFDVSASGLVKLSLPIQTVDAARAGLEDLRLYDDDGNAVPYFIERPQPAERVSQAPKSFRVSLVGMSTLVLLETGLSQPLSAVTLDTPAPGFVKAVRVEGSADGRIWQTIEQGQVIFRQGGASQLRVSFPARAWNFLRLVVDDNRSQPVAFIGAQIHAAEAAAVPAKPLPIRIRERHEMPGETRLALDLGAAHLQIASLQIETDEPLFTRRVTLAVPEITAEGMRERAIIEAVIYRVAVADSPVSSNLKVSLERHVDSRELLFLIHNQDSPPLTIDGVRAERRPASLVFRAAQPGRYHLLTGNSRCAAPGYDLAALSSNLKDATLIAPVIVSLISNPSYRPPEMLPGVGDSGSALDVSTWAFRKAIQIVRAGAQVVELDAEVLSGARPGFEDLRLMRGGHQAPYILERTSISRPVTASVTATNDPKNPTVSRWLLKLSHRKLPVTQLTCSSTTALFQREAVLYEEIVDERGDRFRHVVGRASWSQTPARSSKDFGIALDATPQTDTFVLEMNNGDNLPIDLENFRLFLPLTRVLFKARPEDELVLYYGNPNTPAPRYDLGLVAGELLSAEKSPASLSPQEQLRKTRDPAAAGAGGLWFWAALAVVIVVLLAVISRLLPKTASPAL